ncbi:MAG: hypothetical protein HYZ02_02550 [Candidatus Levybacteria bacterium]|nr:hypothetical protein [Candidatus Levybacteria bacterium]MBI3093094.1 hypothetical protein [Candidatus Levybacteria bacterium]
MDSLRLLCTKDKARARKLAHLLGSTNRERQQITEETVLHAKSKVIHSTSSGQKSKVGNLLFIAHESYQQGVIGLVAGKLVEEFYRPSIVVSVGDKYSKASARSVAGFNIIEFIRSASEFLVDAGGHPMAAGFTVETEKLAVLQQTLEERASKLLNGELLTRTLRVDCELPLLIISEGLYDALQKLAPFGMKNPEPTFVARNVIIEDLKTVGNDGRHLKLKLNQELRIMNQGFDAIAFGMGERASEFHITDRVDIVYTIDEDRWNGNEKLQLKIKDLKKS